MISAKDLMIGDWVYDTILQGYTKVEKLTLSGIRGNINDAIWNEKSFEPIPLTADILKKNGFEMESNGNYWFSDEDEGLEITFFPKEGNYTNGAYDYVDIYRGCLSIIELPISFVHELQHALRLCGIEHEITL